MNKPKPQNTNYFAKFNAEKRVCNYSAINLPKNLTLSREDAKFLIINSFWLLTCCRLLAVVMNNNF